jgi:hypothetical protein
MASTGVFVRVVCALKDPIKDFPSAPSIILTKIKHSNSQIHQKMGTEIDFYEGGQPTKQTERKPRIMVDLIN